MKTYSLYLNEEYISEFATLNQIREYLVTHGVFCISLLVYRDTQGNEYVSARSVETEYLLAC